MVGEDPIANAEICAHIARDVRCDLHRGHAFDDAVLRVYGRRRVAKSRKLAHRWRDERGGVSLLARHRNILHDRRRLRLGCVVGSNLLNWEDVR